MTCPNCGTENPAGARYCIQCGTELPRVCQTCGTVNPASARFCMQCGTPLAAGAAPAGRVPAAAALGGTSTRPADETTPAAGVGPADSLSRMRRASSDGMTGTLWLPRPRLSDGRVRVAASKAEPLGEERRIVTVLFADITSSTQIADALDPEEMRDLLAAYFTAMTHEVHRHGGTVEKYIGDAVMAVFGLPLAHEDDPLRAVRAALDMRAALRSFNEGRRASDPTAPELHMRIGINTGDVVAAGGPAGTEGHDFLVTGDAVNVAARLQEVAVPDTILVGPRAYRATRGAVVYNGLPSVRVRGKPQPIRVWEAVAMAEAGDVPAPLPRGIEGLRAPLVGRDAEMELLRALYTRTRAERLPHLVTVLGVPGIGKTRLVREFINWAVGFSPIGGPDAPLVHAAEEMSEVPDGPLVLEGRCPPYGEGITYWPLAEMLRTYCGLSTFSEPERARARLLECVTSALADAERREDPVIVAAFLGHTIGIESQERRQALLPADSQSLQDGLFRAWRAFFEALAELRPVIVMIDDIHWADDALLDLIEYVANRGTTVPLLLLCPARPELLEKRPGWGQARRNDVTIALEPLPERESARLVQALLPGASVPDSLRRSIQARADGNPFYAEEIIRMLADRGILVRTPAGTEASAPDAPAEAEWRVAAEWKGSPEVADPVIPDTVQGVLAARLDLLAPAERTVLQHASIIGRYFWVGALQALAPELDRPALEGILASLLRRDLIQESERGAEVAAPGERVYSFKHALTREVTYGTIPRTRRAREHERVAQWLESTAPFGGDAYVELLAQHYQQFYVQSNLARSRSAAPREAVREKVLHYLSQAGDIACTRHATAKAERYYSDALAVLSEDPRPEDRETLIDLRMKRGDVRWLQTKGDDAWGDYREALRLWTEVTDEQHGAPDGQGEAATTAVLSPEWIARGLRLYRLLVQLPTRHPAWFSDAPTHEELRGYLQQGLDLADRSGQRETLDGAALLTAKSFFWWSWPEQRGERELLDALRSAREAVRITEALGDARRASEALDALANMQATTTDLRGHLETQVRRLHWAEQIDDAGELVDIHASVSSGYEYVGSYQQAVEHATIALQLANAEENDLLRVQALQRGVVAYFDWDHWPEALDAGQRLRSVTARMHLERSNHEREMLIELAIIDVRMGKRDEAETLLRLVRDVPDTQESLYVGLARGRLALARGTMKEAERHLLAALEYRPGRYAVAALLAELAELGARSGNRELYDCYGTQALELGWRSGARKSLAQATRARGIVAMAEGRLDDAEADLVSAMQRYDELGTTWEGARTRYALAGLARRRGGGGELV
jgi:class 3 adenylate cyclase/tetratricopeptide (TPR) repeat protein